MATYDIEIAIESRVVVTIEADNPEEARKQAEELCGGGDYSSNVPEIMRADVIGIWLVDSSENARYLSARADLGG